MYYSAVLAGMGSRGLNECLTQALTICTNSKVQQRRKFLCFKSKIRHNRWFRPSLSKTFKSIQKFPLESSQRSPFIYVSSIYIILTTCQTLHGLMDLILKTPPWDGHCLPWFFLNKTTSEVSGPKINHCLIKFSFNIIVCPTTLWLLSPGRLPNPHHKHRNFSNMT